MFKVIKLSTLLILIIIFSGCSVPKVDTVADNIPTPKKLLEEPDADIFVLDGAPYSNAEDVDWVMESDFSIGELVGEITKQSNHAGDFKNGTANKLPIGTKIYGGGKGFVIAIVGEKKIPYLIMVEG